MSIRIVILGDIVGTPGRLAVTQALPAIRQRFSPQIIIANAENASNGTGLTPELYHKLVAAGIDGMTLGDHVYKKKQITSILEQEANIIRPANLPASALGKRWMKLQAPAPGAPTPTGGQSVDVFVLTVLGRLFMSLPANDPFATVDQLLGELPGQNPIVLVEMHAEATSEKVAMGWHLNNKVAVVFGTHTHVATADARILPHDVPHGQSTGAQKIGGTAYISDLGMCGPMDSVLGRRADRVLTQMTTAMPAPFDVADGNPCVNGIIVDIDPTTSRATHIERIEIPADTTKPPFVAG